MKKIIVILIAIAIAITTAGQSIGVNVGLSTSNEDTESFDPGLSAGLKVNVLNFNAGNMPTYVSLEGQYSGHKAWGSSEKYSSYDVGSGWYVTSRYADGGIVAGMSINSLPDRAIGGNNYVAASTYETSVGYYVGISGIFKLPLGETVSLFAYDRLAFKSFTSTYDFMWIGENNDMYFESGEISYDLLQNIFGFGLQVNL